MARKTGKKMLKELKIENIEEFENLKEIGYPISRNSKTKTKKLQHNNKDNNCKYWELKKVYQN